MRKGDEGRVRLSYDPVRSVILEERGSFRVDIRVEEDLAGGVARVQFGSKLAKRRRDQLGLLLESSDLLRGVSRGRQFGSWTRRWNVRDLPF